MVYYDFGGPDYDWAARLGIGRLHMDGQSLGLGIACLLILASLPKLKTIGTILNVAPLRFLGIISYSVYITHFFYIRINFPELVLFSQAGTDASYKHFQTLPAAPWWYLPFLFLPGALFWGAVSFLLIERPGMRIGNYITKRVGRAHPVSASAE